MGHSLELPRYDVRSDMGFRSLERAIPGGEKLDGIEEANILDGSCVARTGGDDHLGVQTVERSGDDKGDR